jgi:hypothetical protein
MKQYNVVGFDAKDERLYEVVVEAPNQAIAWTMVLAQMCRNFATAPLADRTDRLVIRAAQQCAELTQKPDHDG